MSCTQTQTEAELKSLLTPFQVSHLEGYHYLKTRENGQQVWEKNGCIALVTPRAPLVMTGE